MTTAIVPFDFSGQQVRVVTDSDGEPWFVARDVCAVLDLGNVSMAVSRLAEDEKGVSTADTPGGAQQVGIVSEPGLYRLIFTSRRPEAEAFRRWVTHDVLPTIRRTGSYNVPDISTPAGVLAMAEQFADTARALVAAEAKVAELEPKADLADTYLIAEGGSRKVREAAKLLRMRERDLRRFLLDEKLIFSRHARCGDVQYDFYAEFAHHFQAVEHVINHTWGSCSHYTLLITPRGIDLIRRRMAKVALPADEAAEQLHSVAGTR
ncbi:MAG TPA: phage antirepressor [Solirubrobacteraceae bacterium]|nr:phage antirepressor [Solirubrobacteraceae bacterium]